MFELRPIFSALLRSKASPLLILLQLVLTLAIIANAMHMIDERLALMQRDSGLPESELFTFNLRELNPDAPLEQQRRLDEAALRALPGVIDASSISQVPLSQSGSQTGMARQPNAPEEIQGVSYFQGPIQLASTLGLTLLEGRWFNEAEVTATKSNREPSQVILSADAAKQLFGEESALGKQVYIGNDAAEVIGIYQRMQSQSVRSRNLYHTAIYPIESLTMLNRFMVRVEPGQLDSVMAQVEDTLLALEPYRVVSGFRSMAEVRQDAYRNDNAMARLLTLLSVLLLGVTLVGVVGQVNYTLVQRRKQIGIRRALGCSRGAIVRHFLLENLMIALAGVTLGAMAALALNQALMGVFEIGRLPLTPLASTMAGLLLLCQGATLVPALRAAQISPALATRSA
ncbi:ABC transporter permease [Ferrimonas marina]|uniref:Putative ABC transport system permease protein n=1 Tax=Ferrimonas marina TaxID=299255 RepID=A0A1M5YT42_9GAMM|nr:ABC transporter permease [Ferrimonas marina]SHI15201.1 putative ABC transport system permease protein [Ferrimonas marina]